MPAHKLLLCASAVAAGGAATLVKAEVTKDDPFGSDWAQWFDFNWWDKWTVATPLATTTSTTTVPASTTPNIFPPTDPTSPTDPIPPTAKPSSEEEMTIALEKQKDEPTDLIWPTDPIPPTDPTDNSTLATTTSTTAVPVSTTSSTSSTTATPGTTTTTVPTSTTPSVIPPTDPTTTTVPASTTPNSNVFPPSAQLSSEEYMTIELEKKNDELKAALVHLVTRAADQMEFMSKEDLLHLEHTDKNNTPLPHHPALSMYRNNVEFIDAIFQDAAAANGVGWTGEDMWAYLFPLRAVTPDGAHTMRDGIYSYLNFLRAVALYPTFCFEKAYWVAEPMEQVCRRELASMFSHFTQDVGAHAPDMFPFMLPDGSSTTAEEWRQGLFHVEEMGCGWERSCPEYSSMCDPAEWQGQAWPCQDGEEYFGRGAKPLSYNYNYGVLSAVVFGDVGVLLNDPGMVSRTWLALASAIYFSMQPRPPAPSIHEMITGFWRPGHLDVAQRRSRGFGLGTLIVHGGIECGVMSDDTVNANLMKYYEGHATALGIWDVVRDERNDCVDIIGFDEHDLSSSGNYPSYWAPAHEVPTCSVVPWETAYSAYIEGDYESCVLNTHFAGADSYPAPRTPEEQAALEAHEAAGAAGATTSAGAAGAATSAGATGATAAATSAGAPGAATSAGAAGAATSAGATGAATSAGAAGVADDL